MVHSVPLIKLQKLIHDRTTTVSSVVEKPVSNFRKLKHGRITSHVQDMSLLSSRRLSLGSNWCEGNDTPHLKG
jgi:hypothetical protein